MFKSNEQPNFECVTLEETSGQCFTDCGPMDSCNPDDNCNPDNECNPDK